MVVGTLLALAPVSRAVTFVHMVCAGRISSVVAHAAHVRIAEHLLSRSLATTSHRDNEMTHVVALVVADRPLAAVRLG